MPTKPVSSSKPAAKMSRAERLAAMQERLSKIDLSSGGSGFWSPKEGRSVIRVLPPVKGMEENGEFWQTIGVHKIPPKGEKRMYCPKVITEGQEDCPICEYVDELFQSRDKASVALAKTLRASPRYWVNVVVRFEKGQEISEEKQKPQIWGMPKTCFGDIVGAINDPDFGDVTDPDEGFDMTVIRKGTGMTDTEYDVKPRRNPSPLASSQDIIDKWLEDAQDLHAIQLSDDPKEDKVLSKDHAVFYLPYDRLSEEFDGVDIDIEEAEEPEEEEDEKPKRKAVASSAPARSATKKPVKKVVDEEEEEPSEEPEEESDDVEKELTRRMARRRSR